MRRLTGSLGLGLFSCLLLSAPGCGDDNPGDTGTNGTGHTNHDSHGTHNTNASGGGTNSTPGGTNSTAGSGGTSSKTSTTGKTTEGATMGTGGGTMGSGSNDSTGDTSGDMQPKNGDEAVKGLIGELCGWAERCCNSGEFDYIFGEYVANAEKCTDRMYLEYMDNDNVDPTSKRMKEAHGPLASLLGNLAFGISRSASEPVTEMVNKCAAQIKALDCNSPEEEGRCSKPETDPENPCLLENLFTGKLAADAPCQDDYKDYGRDIECVAGTSCEDKNNGVGTPDYRCVTKGKKGELCTPEATKDKGSCEQDQYCHSSGTCVDRPGLGGACEFFDDKKVASGQEKIPCKWPYSCDPNSKKCVDSCTGGAPCSDDDSCPEGLSCLPYVVGGVPVENASFCGAPVGSAGTCDTTEDCKDGYFCPAAPGKTAQCERVLEKNNMTPCSKHEQCDKGLYCDSDTKCKSKIAVGDDCNKDLPEAEKQCVDAAIGCFTTDTGDGNPPRAVCVASKVKVDKFCNPAEVAQHPDYKYLTEGTWNAVNPSGLAWTTICDTGVCAPNDVCAFGVAKGQACDHKNPQDKGYCGQGLHCVKGICEEFLKPGESCDKESNDQDQNDFKSGFPLKMCDPDSTCTESSNGWECNLITRSTRRTNCGGANAGTGF